MYFVNRWRDTTMLPLSDDNLEQTSGYGLRIRMVGMRDLGGYTCQAYNALGPAASTTMIVQALGPIGKQTTITLMEHVESECHFRLQIRPRFLPRTGVISATSCRLRRAGGGRRRGRHMEVVSPLGSVTFCLTSCSLFVYFRLCLSVDIGQQIYCLL